MRPRVLMAAIGASAVLGGVVGGAVVRVIDRPEVAAVEADRDRMARLIHESSADAVKLMDHMDAQGRRLRVLETVVGGCSCPKPR